ncbi:hypothetical protein GCM10010151_07530 [Actinoallomurus spadix]|uniref:Uncharacterized protein n=1 Tax=Actinoallomurus spadix TaxID=79912 RepID=A0ABN0VY74_9ACTN
MINTSTCSPPVIPVSLPACPYAPHGTPGCADPRRATAKAPGRRGFREHGVHSEDGAAVAAAMGVCFWPGRRGRAPTGSPAPEAAAEPPPALLVAVSLVRLTGPEGR